MLILLVIAMNCIKIELGMIPSILLAKDMGDCGV